MTGPNEEEMAEMMEDDDGNPLHRQEDIDETDAA